MQVPALVTIVRYCRRGVPRRLISSLAHVHESAVHVQTATAARARERRAGDWG